MAYLLYCIVHGGRDDLVFPDATIRVRRAGLAAVVSEVFPDPDESEIHGRKPARVRMRHRTL
jgi:hypothetical protein